MIDFLQFLFTKVHRSHFDKVIYETFIEKAAVLAHNDCLYHYPEVDMNEFINNIERDTNWLPVYLYRMGNLLYHSNPNDSLIPEIHQLMREICSMEIYFSINIQTGFEVRHGLGTVIGSRCTIGKGFIIHQGCTIGHRNKFGNGPTIGNNVEMGEKSTILGEINIGANVKIGAHSLILHKVEDNKVVYGTY